MQITNGNFEFFIWQKLWNICLSRVPTKQFGFRVYSLPNIDGIGREWARGKLKKRENKKIRSWQILFSWDIMIIIKSSEISGTLYSTCFGYFFPCHSLNSIVYAQFFIAFFGLLGTNWTKSHWFQRDFGPREPNILRTEHWVETNWVRFTRLHCTNLNCAGLQSIMLYTNDTESSAKISKTTKSIMAAHMNAVSERIIIGTDVDQKVKWIYRRRTRGLCFAI